jgi:hypothetical protein
MYCLLLSSVILVPYTPVPLPKSRPPTTQTVIPGVYVIGFCTNSGEGREPFNKYVVDLQPNGTYIARSPGYMENVWRGSWYWCDKTRQLIFNEEVKHDGTCTMYYSRLQFIHKPPDR